MNKQEMKDLQDIYLTQFDEKYLGSTARIEVVPFAGSSVDLYERVYNSEKGTFSKPKKIGGASPGSFAYTFSEVGNIITEKVEPQFGLIRWYSWAVSTLDDDKAFEQPRIERDWEGDPDFKHDIDEEALREERQHMKYNLI